MHLGIAIFPTDTTMQPVALARAVEARGFESLWFPEHSHIPASRATPWAGRQGAPPLPEHYWRTHDQFVALAAAAAVTETLRLGTAITLVAQRDPIWLAKEVASLDTISDGRFQLGVGYGWNREEMAHHGVDYASRRDAVREKVMAMKQLWTEEEAEFHGDHVEFDPSWAWPKPVQRPHPPIVLGGAGGPMTFGAVVELYDGWMPLWGRSDPLSKVDDLHRIAEEAGRDPSSIELTMFAAPPKESALDELRTHGFTRALLSLPQGPESEVVEALDRYADLL